MTGQDFPYLTLTQVMEVDDYVAGLQEVPTIKGITVAGLEALLPRLALMLEDARELEAMAERAGFPMNEAAQNTYGSVARVYVQGPGSAQVRLDVSKAVYMVDVDEEDQDEYGDLLTLVNREDQQPSLLRPADGTVVELFKDNDPRPEGTV